MSNMKHISKKNNSKEGGVSLICTSSFFVGHAVGNLITILLPLHVPSKLILVNNDN